MNKLIKIAPLVMALMLSACEDKDTDSNKAETPQEVTTTNVNDGAFYYNLEEKNKIRMHTILHIKMLMQGKAFLCQVLA